MTHESARELNEFWFAGSREGPAAALERVEIWFRGGSVFDDALRQRFASLVERAAAGSLDGWAAEPAGRLALIIALDQLPRNLFRRTHEAFAQDPKALALCEEGLELEHDLALSPMERLFFYMPLEHAEDRAVQGESVRRFERLRDDAPEFGEVMNRSLTAVYEHRDTVERFGRFPHRNEVLGRVSTPGELAFLAAGARTYGQ